MSIAKKFDYNEDDYNLEGIVYAEFSADGGLVTVENVIAALNILVALGQMSGITAKSILAKYKKKPEENHENG